MGEIYKKGQSNGHKLTIVLWGYSRLSIDSPTIARIHTMAIVRRQQYHTIVLHALIATLKQGSIDGELEIGFVTSLGKWSLRAQEVLIESGETRENVRWAAI